MKQGKVDTYMMHSSSHVWSWVSPETGVPRICHRRRVHVVWPDGLGPCIYRRIPVGIKTAAREGAHTKQHIKGKLHTRGGKAGTSSWEGATARSSNGGCLQSSVDSAHRWGGGPFDPPGCVLEPSKQLSSVRGWVSIQNANEWLMSLGVTLGQRR